MSIAELMRIDRTIEIAAPPERVWRTLTSPAEFSEWFRVKIDGDIAAGAEVWMTSTEPKQGHQRFRVWFRELTPPRRLVWEWHPGSVDATLDYSREPRTTVTFTLEPSTRGTRLRVEETGFDAISLPRRAKVYGENSGGWGEVLATVQQYVEANR
jgi:uncharacterized protein YndB with AHSA1/START domain